MEQGSVVEQSRGFAEGELKFQGLGEWGVLDRGCFLTDIYEAGLVRGQDSSRH